MKRWAILTIVLYGAVLMLLSFPVLMLLFVGEASPKEILKGYEYWQIWAWFGAMMLIQAALLVVPVHAAEERLVKRRHVVWTFAAILLLTVVMVVAAGLAVWETIIHTKGLDNFLYPWFFTIIAAIWTAWMFVFGFYIGKGKPENRMSCVVKFLIAGSILELLVVVPMHIIARARNYCCAGFLTMWGIAAGISIMLLAFGPGVFMLFVRRWGDLKRKNLNSKPAEDKCEAD
ncbi:MAG: hypothetical protein K8S55_12020 [Phycisphaerae bacterium]|nr:hypothetical protein [Phycisphaerae bacterium]